MHSKDPENWTEQNVKKREHFCEFMKEIFDNGHAEMFLKRQIQRCLLKRYPVKRTRFNQQLGRRPTTFPV